MRRPWIRIFTYQKIKNILKKIHNKKLSPTKSIHGFLLHYIHQLLTVILFTYYIIYIIFNRLFVKSSSSLSSPHHSHVQTLYCILPWQLLLPCFLWILFPSIVETMSSLLPLNRTKDVLLIISEFFDVS